MPWVHALLKGQKVYARANEQGELVAAGGRVEVRYKPKDGRRYEARADNLTVVSKTPLPDDTCAPAEAVKKEDAKPVSSGGARRTSSAPEKVEKIPDGAIIVYADGACSGNPGPAGLGVVILDGDMRVELSEYLGVGTNNIAELTAVKRAIEEVADPDRPIVLHTDSQYTIGVLQKGWKAKANVELIAKLREALKKRRSTRLVYVRGHAGVPLNERADALAREAVSNRKSRRAALPNRPE